MLDVGSTNADISSCMVSAENVVLAARGRKKSGRQNSASVMKCASLWF